MKLKMPKLESWPVSKPSPATPPCKYSKTSVKEDKSRMKDAGNGSKDSRPWNSTKIAAYDKQC